MPCINFGDQTHYLAQIPYKESIISILGRTLSFALSFFKHNNSEAGFFSTIRSYSTLAQYTHRTEISVASNRVIFDAN
jgi:transposase